MNNKRRRNNELNMLSAYLDNELDAAERNWLEKRLSREPVLRERLEKLRRTKITLGYLSRLKTPRNFTLTPELVPVRQKNRQPVVTFLRLASSFAAVLLVLLVGMELVLGNGFLAGRQQTFEAPAMASDSSAAESTPEPLIMWDESQSNGQKAESGGYGGGSSESEQLEQPITAEQTGPTEELLVEEETISEEKAEGAPKAGEAPILGLQPEDGGEIVARSEPAELQIDTSTPWQDAVRWVEIALAVIVLSGGVILWFLRNK